MRVSLWAFLICTIGAAQVEAAEPPCPASHELTLPGSVFGTNNGDTPDNHLITMYPCEEFSIDIIANEGNPLTNGDLYIKVYNSTNGVLAQSNWQFNSSLSFPGALPLDSFGFPLPGTRQTSGNVARIEVYSVHASATYPISYQITVHLVARPGYNRAGLSYQDAFGPLTNGSVINASMGNSHNYYRISLVPKGTLQLSGILVNEAWSNGTTVSARVFNLAEQQLATLFSKGVPANTSHNPDGNSVAFTSSTFTNSDAAVTDLYIRLTNSGSAKLHASTINVAASAYQPDCNCQAAYNGGMTPWTGTRTVLIQDGGPPTGIGSEDRAEIVQAIHQWNQLLAGLGVPITFQVVTSGTPDILVYASAPSSGAAAWLEGDSPPDNGQGLLKIHPNYLGQGKANLIWHLALHEFGHALDHSDLTTCTVRDAVMYDPVPINGPFPGLTCADSAAVDAAR